MNAPRDSEQGDADSENRKIQRALIDSTQKIPEALLVADDGSRATELESAIAALQHATKDSDAGAGAALAAARIGNPRPGEQWFSRIAKAKAQGNVEERREAASAYRHKAALASLHDRAVAIEALRRAALLTPDDPAVWARLGQAAPTFDDAEYAYRRAIELAAALVEARGATSVATKRDLAISLSNLAQWLFAPTQDAAAEALMMRALQLYEELGDRADLARQLTRCGIFFRSRSLKREGLQLFVSKPASQRAASYFARALELYAELREPAQIAELLGCQALIASDRNQFGEAEGLYRRALELAEQCGARETAITQLQGLGNLYTHVERYDEAQTFFDRAQQARRATPPGLFAPRQLVAEGAELLDDGDIDGAASCFERAHAIFDAYGQAEGLARALTGLGMVSARRGDVEGAKTFWTQARAYFDDVGMLDEMAEVDELASAAAGPLNRHK